MSCMDRFLLLFKHIVTQCLLQEFQRLIEGDYTENYNQIVGLKSRNNDNNKKIIIIKNKIKTTTTRKTSKHKDTL